ncbi:MAG: hypothetical protein KC766_12080 [Myxococcales bacterium]|nr:hypothetical protein [Myxococcales bacterium]
MFRGALLLALPLAWCLFAASAQAEQLQPKMLGDTRLESQAGSSSLTWKAEHESGPEPTYELQRATDPDFENPKTLYRGPDQGRFVSGMLDGSYYYRVRARQGEAAWSTWSEPQELVVTHWSRTRALGLMAVGALVFLAIVFVVLNGTRKVEPS